MILCPETMGKVGQLGTLDEVLALCEVDQRITPCIDFGHLYARSCGVQLPTPPRPITPPCWTRMAARLGDDRAVHFHAHFSRIEYSKGGEKRHWTFAETQFGPEPQPLMELLAERDLAPVIICESAGTAGRGRRRDGPGVPCSAVNRKKFCVFIVFFAETPCQMLRIR